MVSNKTMLDLIIFLSTLDKKKYDYQVEQNDSDRLVIEIDNHWGGNEFCTLNIDLKKHKYSILIKNMEAFCEHREFDEENITLLLKVRKLAKDLLKTIKE